MRRLIAERRIAYTKLGKFVRITSTDLDEFISAGRVEALRPGWPVSTSAAQR